MEKEYENIMIKEAHFFPMRLTTGAIMAVGIVGVLGILVFVASFIGLSVMLAFKDTIEEAF
jgi:hypothetical protein